MKKLLLLALGVLALGLIAACGDGGGGEKGEVEDVIRAFSETFNAKDVDAHLALFTDDGIAKLFEGATRQEAREELAGFIGEEPLVFREFVSTEVSANTATTEVETVNLAVEIDRFSLVKEGEVWLIDGIEFGAGSPDIPGGVTAVDVEAAEFAFSFDAEQASKGDIAFRIRNVGEQPHVLLLAKIPEDGDVEQFLPQPQQEGPPPEGPPPEGLEVIAGIDVLEPGGEANVVFTEALPPGRYLMICDEQDEETGKPHFQLGMFAELTVE